MQNSPCRIGMKSATLVLIYGTHLKPCNALIQNILFSYNVCPQRKLNPCLDILEAACLEDFTKFLKKYHPLYT